MLVNGVRALLQVDTVTHTDLLGVRCPHHMAQEMECLKHNFQCYFLELSLEKQGNFLGSSNLPFTLL